MNSGEGLLYSESRRTRETANGVRDGNPHPPTRDETKRNETKRNETNTEKQIQAIEFLHSMKLIHTDLKPENVLLNSWDDREVTLDSGDVIRVPVNPHIKGERREGNHV